MVEIQWADVQKALKEQAATTKTLLVPLAGIEDVPFVIRALTQREEDAINGHATVKPGQHRKGDTEVTVDIAERKIQTFMAGVISGPPGFNPKSRADIADLPADVRDGIVEQIGIIGELDEVTRLCFRAGGPRP